MSYSNDLQKRLRDTAKARRRSGAGAGQTTSEDLGFVHPRRYPKHQDPAKGQVWDGECNVTRCTSRRARFFNRSTFGLYCPTCARGIGALCVPVMAKPTEIEMRDMKRDAMTELFS